MLNTVVLILINLKKFNKLEEALLKIFPFVELPAIKEVGMGKSYFIGNNKKELVKLDLYYTDPFVFPCVFEQNIRFSSLKEVAAMKLEVIGQGGRKKDFWDVHELLETYSLADMLDFYIKRNPYGYSKEELLIKMIDFSVAEYEFTPNCFNDKDWEIIKLDFECLVER